MPATFAWAASSPGRPPLPIIVTLLLLPLMVIWTLPQTLSGLALALWRRGQGYRLHLYQFGPFLYLVLRAPGVACAGISLGVVVFAPTPAILKHELCHLITGLWLSWLYLPIYGVEYLLFGHDGSPHERLTCWFDQHLSWEWRLLV